MSARSKRQMQAIIDNHRQRAFTGTGPDLAGLARLKAAQSLQPKKPQQPCDHGLFEPPNTQMEMLNENGETRKP